MVEGLGDDGAVGTTSGLKHSIGYKINIRQGTAVASVKVSDDLMSQ
jgi:hypothetical protein